MLPPPSTARRGAAARVAESLKSAIVDGSFGPGDALPSERDLAERYEVNRSSIREALQRLEALGLVRVRHGGATRVTDFRVSAGLDVLPLLMDVGGKADPGILSDLHEIRGLLLGWCAERAAELADSASVLRLDDLARKMADRKAKPVTLQELDYDFFEELVRISGNRILLLLSNVVREVYMRGREHYLPLYEQGVFDPSWHRRAVAAVREHDARSAGDAMRAHAASALRTLEAR